MTHPSDAPAGPVVDLSRSPHAVLHPVPLSAVQIQDAFWAPRLTLNREATLPSQLRHCEETGRIDNFRRAAGKKQGDFQGIYFNDSDVYKLAEAMAYSLATHPDSKLDADLEAVIADIAAAQDPDGYLNTYFMFEKSSERFKNLRDMHEIYCAGHLIQAAVAHYRATGKTTFLQIATRLADHLDANFGPEGRSGACGHEEAEMALAELYRATNERRYLTLAQRMIDARGQTPPVLSGSQYHQDHLPFSQQAEFVGHAVRHLYLVCGATDVVAETGNADYRQALSRLWDDLTQCKMYVTGGAGSRWEGEAFGAAYELPNGRAYTETCAAIGSVMWNWRMLQLTGDSKFADLMETTLYNGVLAGLSLDGQSYFYQNPLADRGKHRREAWFGCACCPPNVARLLASLPGYVASVDEESASVHLYAAGTAILTTGNGGQLTLTQRTRYPWDGSIEIEVSKVEGPVKSLRLRIPWWAEGAQLSVGGQAIEQAAGVEAGSYATVDLRGHRAVTIHLTLPMAVERTEAHPHVLGNLGRVALRRGPLVYCIEQADHLEADVWDILLPDDSAFTLEHRADLLGGVTVLHAPALATDSAAWDGALYAPHHPPQVGDMRPVTLTAIPYYAWANREPGPMQVWIPALQ